MILTPLSTAGAGAGFRNRVQQAAHAVNQSASRSMKSGKNKNGQESREDRVQLNPMRQAQSMLDHLMEQKQNLIEQKNQLVADTLAAGGDMDSIRALVSLYDEQINNIDVQISQTMKDMVEDQLEKAEEKEEKEPETKEELQIRQLNNLSNASLDYEQVKQVHSAHEQKKRDASILSMEIKMDNSRGGVSQGKKDRLAEVLKEADELYTEAMKGYVDLNVSLKDEEKEHIEKQQQLEGSGQREEETGEASQLQHMQDLTAEETEQEEENS